VDISGFSVAKLIAKDSNPGRITICCGGVARNIAENLARLGVETRLLTIVGRDAYGDMILDNCRECGLNCSMVEVRDDLATSIDLALHDEVGEMVLSISQMETAERLNSEFIDRHEETITNSAAIVLDTNLSQNCIEYIVKRFAGIDILVDAVAFNKARKIECVLDHLHTVKMNELEAQALVGREIRGATDVESGCRELLQRGLSRVFVSCGADGVFAADDSGLIRLSAPPVSVVNDRGAGDAFMAGVVYSYVNDYSMASTTRFAMAAARLTLSHEKTVNPDLSIEAITRTLEEFGN